MAETIVPNGTAYEVLSIGFSRWWLALRLRVNGDEQEP